MHRQSVIFALVLSLLPVLAQAQRLTATWTDASDNEDSFVLERRTGQTGTFVDVGHPSQNSQSWVDQPLVAGQEYCYRIKAVNVAGSSGYSNIACGIPAAINAGIAVMQSCVYTPTPPVSANLVAGYAFSEGSGMTTADSSGNTNTGTLTNSPTWTTAGKVGTALSFDGTNDFVSAADNASLDLGTTGTIEAWVKLDTLGRWHGIIAKGSANSDAVHNYALEVTNGNIITGVLGNGSSYRQINGTVTATANTWTHIAMTWDGTTVRLYLNGTLNASVTQNFTPTGNTSPLSIGQFGGNADRLDGTIDSVRIYNRALTQSEIHTDMGL